MDLFDDLSLATHVPPYGLLRLRTFARFSFYMRTNRSFLLYKQLTYFTNVSLSFQWHETIWHLCVSVGKNSRSVRIRVTLSYLAASNFHKTNCSKMLLHNYKLCDVYKSYSTSNCLFSGNHIAVLMFNNKHFEYIIPLKWEKWTNINHTNYIWKINLLCKKHLKKLNSK